MNPATATAPPAPRVETVAGQLLGHYPDRATGEQREIVLLHAAADQLLVVDRLVRGQDDARIVGQIAADEPAENAQLLARLYLADEDRRGRCAPLAQHTPHPAAELALPEAFHLDRQQPVRDRAGLTYRLSIVQQHGGQRELRWTRADGHADGELISVRSIAGNCQDYEPVRTRTLAALHAYTDHPAVSTCVLRTELERLNNSPVLLNRLLRERIQTAAEDGELTYSEIAMRCGRVKRDRRGNVSGESSWLARRIGQMPEAGGEHPTPWIHSDVLALIAREGLGIAPSEVEL
jgi:hypothetical protein